VNKLSKVGVSAIAVALLCIGCNEGPTTPFDCRQVLIRDANSERCDPVAGIITAIVIDEPDAVPVFLVEEQPNEPDRGQKMFFSLSQQTEILIELRSGLLVPGTVADLAVGTRVRAWKGPIVTLSYPGGTTAPRIEVIR
jgi:hypothetical protein